jgi:isopentenyl-diphosphate delta-isomerase
MTGIESRKQDHLELTARGDVGFRTQGTLFSDVQLVHDALPELHLDEVDLSCTVLGKRLRAPILIAGMTGGTEHAGKINRDLAKIAETRGYAMGFGSQRPMLVNAAAVETYKVRDVAPNVLLLGNVGAVQATALEPSAVLELVQAVGADALCVHLNPAMEVVQPEGDKDFRGCLPQIARLAAELPFPVVAKETGCGLSLSVAQRLAAAGVEHLDVSGAGGTSWVGVETLRAEGDGRALGELFWDWGIPTAASLLATHRVGFRTVFATGGLKTGLDVARAIVLGATAGGLARPVIQAYYDGGPDAVERYLQQVERELRTAMLLVGAGNLAQLQKVPRLIGGSLRDWDALWANAERTAVGRTNSALATSGRHS